MSTPDFKEVLDMSFEFILSLVTILGGGYLLYSGKSTDVVISLMTAVITFWFSGRNATKLLGKQQQIQAAKDQAAADQSGEGVNGGK